MSTATVNHVGWAELEMKADSQEQSDTPSISVACRKCNNAAGRIENGVLIYSVRHGGQWHTARIDLKYLEKLLHATKETVVT